MMHRKYKHFALISLVIILISALFVPSAAAQFTITITGAAGDCTATITLSAEAINDPLLLLTGNLGFVLYDGDDSAFAFAGIALSGGSLDLDLGYTELHDPAPGTISGRVYATASTTSVANIEAGTLLATVTFEINDLEACTGIELPPELEILITLDEDSEPFPVFFDGRLNDHDSGAPVVLFPFITEETERGLEVYTASGELVLVVPPEAIAAIEECPEENTLILENEELQISLWRLSSCEFQLMAPTGEPGKWYIIIFDWLDESTFFISFEIYIE